MPHLLRAANVARLPAIRTVLAAATLFLFIPRLAVSAKSVTVVDHGRPRAEVWISHRVQQDNLSLEGLSSTDVRRELDRRRVRDSALDLISSIEKMSGARLPLVVSDAVPHKRRSRRILIGELATLHFGAERPLDRPDSSPPGQAFRIIVEPATVALEGESDLATSYAIYELLQRLGCRWFMPGDLGEVIPRRLMISLPFEDSSLAPATSYRDIWHRDEAFARRNRLGGNKINAGHALERYISPEQRESHPEWCALIDGLRDPSRPQLSWGNPEVADAVSESIIRRLDEDYVDSLSLSPMDTTVFGEGPEDLALDAGDWDPTLHMPSLTDRLLSFANQIAEKVSRKYPDVRLGLLAYVQFTRPPLRERPHPNLAIELAPITYNRAHPMTDDRHPASKDLREIVTGWGEATRGDFACYPYGYNLGEVSAPFPLIRKWSIDLPLLFQAGCRYWQPETMPNFDTSLPGLYLGIRLAWNPALDPKAIVEDLFDRFYGASAPPMKRYWNLIDAAWTESEEYSGNVWGYLQRFSPEVLKEASLLLAEAAQTASSVSEYQRVHIAHRSFAQLDLLLAMRRDLNEGRFAFLRQDAERWAGGQLSLGHEYRENYAFTRTPESPRRSLSVRYFNRFLRPMLESAETLHKEGRILTPKPLREFQYRIDPDQEGLTSGWHTPDFDDADWPVTDVGSETWSTLGHYNFMGSMWYRIPFSLDARKPNREQRVFLWVAGASDELEIFVNGEHCPAVDESGGRSAIYSGYAKPAHFDITSAIRLEGRNLLAIRARRGRLDELGVGGLLGPAVVYQRK